MQQEKTNKTDALKVQGNGVKRSDFQTKSTLAGERLALAPICLSCDVIKNK